MVQESTIVCVDNSEWMRNGDMSPNRLQCEQEAVRILVQFKLRSNPENAVGLLSMAKDIEVLTSLTQEDRKLMAKLHQIEIGDETKVMRAMKTAHLVLKNRPNRNHKTRIVIFIGSPLDNLEEGYSEGEFVKLAKKFKKENVKVDFVLFGEATSVKNQVILDFVDVLNGPDGVGSNVVVVPGDAKLFEALLSSPICRNEDGTGGGEFDFGIDVEDDPELALALRVSLEEQRQRQQAEAGAANGGGAAPLPSANQEQPMDVDNSTSGSGGATTAGGELSTPLKIDGLDPAGMSEEEQIQWALRMSMMNDLPSEGEGTERGEVSTSQEVSSASGNLLQPVSAASGGYTAGSGSENRNEGNKVDDEVLSSAGATASGTPAPTPMETDLAGGESHNNRDRQHSNALGQLMDNPDLLQQLVDQIPEGGGSGSSEKLEKKKSGKQ